MAHNQPWVQLKELPVCTCGRALSKRGMIRELRSNKNNRPGPSMGLIHSSVATIHLHCFGCARSWDVRFLTVDRYERSAAQAVPCDCWPLRPEESPKDALAKILENRRKEANGEVAGPRNSQKPAAMTEEESQRAKRHIAEARARFGW